MRKEVFFCSVFVIFLQLICGTALLADTTGSGDQYRLYRDLQVTWNGVARPADVYVLYRERIAPLLHLPVLGNRLFDPSKNHILTAEKIEIKPENGYFILETQGLARIKEGRVGAHRVGENWRLTVSWPGNNLVTAFPITPPPVMEEAAAAPETGPAPMPETGPGPIPEAEGGPELEYLPLAHGLQWSKGHNPPTIKPPLVKKVPVPPIRTSGIKTFGVAYDIQMETDAAEYPMHISIPLPQEAQANPKNILFLKISGEDRETVLFPSSIDEGNGRATLLVRSFSRIVPGAWDIEYTSVNIAGTMTMKEEAEENPETIYFDMECSETSSGEYANFVLEAEGLGPWKFFMPLPSTHYGTYLFRRIVGFTSNFIFAGDPTVSSPLNIDGGSSSYNVSLNVIPVTTRMEGRVVDGDGNPLEGVRINLEGPYNVTYRTRSRDGGRYLIDYIGMTDSRKAMTESRPCVLVNPEDQECGPITLNLSLTAGKTFRDDLVYHPQGEIRGYIRDKFGNELEEATIEIKPSRGETITREVSSPYHIEHVPIGEATVTVTCPSEVHQQTRTVDIACTIPGIPVDYTNFELECSGEISGHIRDTFGNELEEATIEIKPSRGETITREVSSPYRITDIPVGGATVTAICPAKVHRQTMTADITCEPPGSGKNEIDFELECSGEIQGTIRDRDGTNLQGATIEIRPSRGETITREVSSPYHITDIPVGAAMVTAICPGGQGRQGKNVEISCEAPGSDKADTDFVLDCESWMGFRISDSGTSTSEGYMYDFTVSSSVSFDLHLPRGATEAEVDVTYPVKHEIRANNHPPPHLMSVTPSSYILNAVVRWRVERETRGNGDEYFYFTNEVIHHETRRLKVITSTESEPQEWDMEGIAAAIDLTISRGGVTVGRGAEINEFPFVENNQYTSPLPQALIGISQLNPANPVGESRTVHQSRLSIEAVGGAED